MRVVDDLIWDETVQPVHAAEEHFALPGLEECPCIEFAALKTVPDVVRVK